jgi:HAD superfamily hydrolase (TIGR01662 family)
VITLLQAVFLDLGDTLVHMSRPWDDVFHANLEALYKYVAKLGPELDYDRFASTFVKVFEDASASADVYKVEIPIEDIIGKVLRKSRLEVIGVDLVHDAMTEFFGPEVDAWQVYPDTVEALTTLRNEGLKMGVISNAKGDWAVREILRRNDLNKYFDVVVTSAAMRIRKPRPEIFVRALTDLNVKAPDAAFVGDSIEADVTGARNVGMRPIHVRRRPIDGVNLAGPIISVDSLNEAVTQINAWNDGSKK